MQLDINEIMAILPHRPPFLLVDRILDMEPGVWAKALKNVSMNETFFQGHFPQQPVMPGVLQIEAMAQAGACAILTLEEYKGKIAYLAAVDKAKFRSRVVPGDQLLLQVEIVKRKAFAGIGRGVASVDGKTCAEAEFTFMIGPAQAETI